MNLIERLRLPERPWVGVVCGIMLEFVAAPWRIVTTDMFLGLVAGREVALHGLPHTDELCVVTHGHVWTDQQWLGQLAMWCVEQLGGIHAVVLLDAVLTALAFGLCAWHAKARGHSSAAVLVASGLGFAMASPFLTPRPQLFSVVGFAVLLLVLSDDVRKPSARVFWLIPMLALWANLHGVVVIGAMLVMLRAAFGVLVERRFGRSVLLGVLAAVTPLCTPYALELPHYYHVIGHLQDPVRRLPILEWNRVQWPSDIPFFCVFPALLALVVLVYVKKLPRSHFEVIVLLATGAGAWQAARHLQWYGLAIAAYGAQLFDAIPPVREGTVLRRAATVLTVVAPVLLAAALVRFSVMPVARIEKVYPRGALPVLARLLDEHPDWHLASSDTFADWALWYVPGLRGRIETDVRFELITDAEALDVGAFLHPQDGWDRIYTDAKLLLVSRDAHPDLDKKVVSLPGVQVVWEDPMGRLSIR